MKRFLLLLLCLLPACDQAQQTRSVQRAQEVGDVVVGAKYLPCSSRPVTVDSIKGAFVFYRAYDVTGAAVTSCQSSELQFFSSFGLASPPPPVDTVEVPPPDTTAPLPGNIWDNSAECDPGNANLLLCDDFEDQDWYKQDCGSMGSAGIAGQDGWCGTIYNAAGLAAGTARCGNAGFKSNCAATTGNVVTTTGNMADVNLKEGVTELWLRFYTKPLAGYMFGAEKMLTFNAGPAGSGGIRFGNLSWRCASTAQPTGWVAMGFPAPMDECPNVAEGFTVTSGNWYFYEVHYRISTPGQADGVFELWLDNCGPSGTTCPAVPTKRYTRTNVNNATQTGEQIKSLWFEAWANPESRGERYWDQIVVSKVGPIGFFQGVTR